MHHCAASEMATTSRERRWSTCSGGAAWGGGARWGRRGARAACPGGTTGGEAPGVRGGGGGGLRGKGWRAAGGEERARQLGVERGAPQGLDPPVRPRGV